MNKKLLVFLLALSFFLTPGFLLGEELDRKNERYNQSIERPVSVPVDPNNENNNIEEPVVTSNPVREIRDFSKIRDQRKKEIRLRNVESRKQIERIRKERDEQIQSKQDQFREKLEEIRDQRRRSLAERLAENINKLNNNLSSRYNGFLNAKELVLDKIEIRFEKIEEARGIDLTSTQDSISDARNLINIARTEVISQSAKTYVVSIQSEETLRNDFKTVMEELKNDHKILREEYIFPLRNLIREIMKTLRTETLLEEEKQVLEEEEQVVEEAEKKETN